MDKIGNFRKFSDLDLCFFDDIPLPVKSDIAEEFELSGIPYTVDLVDLNTCDESFKKIIKKEMIEVSI